MDFLKSIKGGGAFGSAGGHFFMKSKNIIFVYFYCLYKNSCCLPPPRAKDCLSNRLFKIQRKVLIGFDLFISKCNLKFRERFLRQLFGKQSQYWYLLDIILIYQK